MSKERLVELLEEAKIKALSTIGSLNNGWGTWYADYLLANGVIVPPCKVGDVVYAITLNPKTNIRKTHRGVVTNIHSHTTGKHITVRHEGLDDEPYFDALYCPFEIFGKTVFLTREEAEKKLEERENNVKP